MTSENIKKLHNLLDCEMLPIDKNSSQKDVMQNYLSLYEKGKTEGFVPVIVAADDILIEKFELDLEDENLSFDKEGMKTYRDKILEKAKELYSEEFFKNEKAELLDELDKEQINWQIGEEEDDELFFSAYLNLDGEINEDIVVLKIPTNRPYEIFAWLPMGGFNDCPTPAEMVAIAKYWQEKHNAQPSTLTYDTVEFYVPNPTTDKEAVIELAMEQYLFDVDIVEQGVGDVESLVETIYLNKQWFFWWD